MSINTTVTNPALGAQVSRVGASLASLPGKVVEAASHLAKPDGYGGPVDTLSLGRVGGAGAGAAAVAKFGEQAVKVGAKGARLGSKAAAAGAGSLGKAFGLSALISVPLAVVTDFLDYKRGKLTKDQRNTLIVADSLGYAATGTAGSMLGAALGTTFLGPGVGTVLGIGAGMGLGYLYERYLRPHFGQAASVPAPLPPDIPAK
jgi:hypothetical protein